MASEETIRLDSSESNHSTPVDAETLLANGTNGSSMYPNISPDDIYRMLNEIGLSNRGISKQVEIILIAAFTLLILGGVIGNCLVIFVVLRRPHMRTVRNIFIFNLAVSDLTLCVFSNPFSLVKVISTKWIFGGFICRLVPSFQATNVFVSTMSITAIALDRYYLIVHPTKESISLRNTVFAIIGIWGASIILASPLFIFRQLEPVRPMDYLGLDIYLYDVCIESWPVRYGGLLYSVGSIIIQYLIPIAIVASCYCRICSKLRYRTVRTLGRRAEEEARRQRRINILLLTIGIIFALSWLPLNIMNLLLELMNDTSSTGESQITFSVCLLLALTSAASNPILYGWLNENFKREFVLILCFAKCCKKRLMPVETEAGHTLAPHAAAVNHTVDNSALLPQKVAQSPTNADQQV